MTGGAAADGFLAAVGFFLTAQSGWRFLDGRFAFAFALVFGLALAAAAWAVGLLALTLAGGAFALAFGLATDRGRHVGALALRFLGRRFGGLAAADDGTGHR